MKGSGIGGQGINASLGIGSSGIGASMFAVGGGVGGGIGSGIGAAAEEGSPPDKAAQNQGNASGSDDGDYEPNLEEIHGYAKFLGMDLEHDQELLYIAEEGLKAPVPEPWKTYFNENDEIFYVNAETNERMYDHPLDEEYKQKYLRLKA